MVEPITVIVPYHDEKGYQELIRTGFLTSEHHAMYVETHIRELVLVGVMPSRRDPDVYIGVTSYYALGRLSSRDSKQVSTHLTARLKEMSAYQFITDVLMPLPTDIDFEKALIPGMLEE